MVSSSHPSKPNLRQQFLRDKKNYDEISCIADRPRGVQGKLSVPGFVRDAAFARSLFSSSLLQTLALWAVVSVTSLDGQGLKFCSHLQPKYVASWSGDPDCSCLRGPPGPDIPEDSFGCHPDVIAQYSAPRTAVHQDSPDTLWARAFDLNSCSA